MTFENEHCRVELILDEPERTYRDVDMISGTVRFEATGQSLSIHCQPKVGLGVEVLLQPRQREFHRDSPYAKLGCIVTVTMSKRLTAMWVARAM